MAKPSIKLYAFSYLNSKGELRQHSVFANSQKEAVQLLKQEHDVKKGQKLRSGVGVTLSKEFVLNPENFNLSKSERRRIASKILKM